MNAKPIVLSLLVPAGIFLAACSGSTKPAAPAQEQVLEGPFSLEEVAQHAGAEDCWLAIEGKVYDVTPFISERKHPGGAAILEGCGTDATQLYETRPMGSGTAHSDAARTLLEKYYLGELTATAK